MTCHPRFRTAATALFVFLFSALWSQATVTIKNLNEHQLVSEGQDASFSVSLTYSGGTLSYAWSLSTDNGASYSTITNDSTYDGATTKTLTVSNVTASLNGYIHRCVVTETGGPAPGSRSTLPRLYVIRDVTWDSGAIDEGTQTFHSPAAYANGNFLFKVTPQSTTAGAWRTMLRVTSGTADLYLNKETPLLSLTNQDYKSERFGTQDEGIIVPEGAFQAGETWYAYVNASADAQWELVSGEAYVQDLGPLAADGSSSSGNIEVGPEGYRFFKTSIPASVAAWRIWLNDGATTPATLNRTISVRRTGVPLVNGSRDHHQNDHMLLVPPYLNTGGDTYFVSVYASPGTTINLDSRSAPVTDVSFGSSTSFSVPSSGYAVYRTQVPTDQIGWQTELRDLSANVDLAVRRGDAGSEWFNDGLSESTGTRNDTVTLVPPVLSDGTYYITLYNFGSAATGTLINRVPFSEDPDDISFLGTSLNDESTTAADDTNPAKVGWRYFRVGVADAAGISAQLGVAGWKLALGDAPNGTEIALRRNFLPGKWKSRNSFNGTAQDSGYYKDFNSFTGELSRIGHQADIWYVGVYSPATPLGNFSLTRTTIEAGETLDVPFAAGSTAITGHQPDTWRYYKFEVPEDSNLLGWDLRVEDRTGGSVTAQVTRAIKPDDGIAADFTLGSFWTRTQEPNGTSDPDKYLIKAYNGRGPTGSELNSNGGRGWLYAGTYYLGVKVSSAAASYTVTSRAIGTADSSYPIQAGVLDFAAGSVDITNLAVRDVAFYRVDVPEGANTWELKLDPSGTGEASMKLSNTGRIPSFDEPLGQRPEVWASAEKRGNDTIYAVKNSNVLQAGSTYYVAVTGEGDSPPNSTRVGTGAISATLTSTSDMPVTALGTATTTPITEAVEVESEAVKLYQFTVAPDTLNVEIRLTDRVGNPRFSVQFGELPSGWGSSNDAYTSSSFRGNSSGIISDSLVTLANPTPGTYTVAVGALNTTGTAYPDATATLSVVATAAADVSFADGTATVSDQANGTWRYFRFDVPEATDLLGWDLRVQDVTGGSIANAQVLRELPPGDGISTDFTLSSFWTRSLDANGTNDPDKYLIKAYDGRGPTPAESGGIFGNNGRGWLYAGTYYLGVKVSGNATSYTVTSRGIGLEASTYPIKVAGDLAFSDGVAQITDLPRRETAIYRVTVPEGAQTWSLTLEPEATGEASIKISPNGLIPGTSEPYAQRKEIWSSNSTLSIANPGTDRFYVAQSSPTDSTRLPPGTYYVTVVGEGDSPSQPNRIGTGAINATLSSVSEIPVTDMGEITSTAAVSPVDIASGELSFYRFTVAPDTPSLEVKLTNKTGSPLFSLVSGDLPARYPTSSNTGFSATFVGGIGASAYGETVTSLGNPPPGTYTVVLGTGATSTTGATANLSIAAGSEQVLTFNDGSVTVTGQEAGTWRYFKVQVPEGDDLLGWDLRILNPDGGNGSLRAYVRRDTPPDPAAEYLNDFGFTSYWGRSQEADGSPDKNLYLVKSNNAPVPSNGAQGWLYPGTYYIGVLALTGGYVIPDEYTIVSRGIGTKDSPFAIKVAGDLDFADGSVQITGLAPRETTIYRVTVPEGAQSWALRLDPEGTGEASLRVSNTGRIASFSEPSGQRPNVWADANKPGTDFVYAAQYRPADSTYLPPGTYYVSVIGEGHSPATSTRFGEGAINATLTSISDIPATSVGTATSTESVTPVALDAEEVKLYRFTVEPGTTSLEVRLTERTGNPVVSLAPGELPGPWGDGDSYGYLNYFGGTAGSKSGNLVTLTNPTPGTYTVAVRAVQSGSTYLDATANLRVVTRDPASLNFSAQQNGEGGSNTSASAIVSDGERTFFEVNVPETLGDSAPLGWKLSAATSQGSVGLYVYSDSSNLTTPIASTTERTLIIAPPLLKAGSFIVEARATGATEFTLTSESIVPRNLETPWELPTADAYTSAADVGDTGAVDLANGDYDFYVVNVPEGNLGLLRTVIEAISGNPDLYIRRNAIPSRNHGAPGETSSGYAYSRYSANASGTEYGNWVPFDDQTETQLEPGTYYLAVHAASNTNLRYRLRVSPGDVQTVALNGGSVSNQLLTGGDWRYYRFVVPAESTVPQSWNLNFTQNSGDAIMHLRDTVPAGQTTYGSYSTSYLRDWQNDAKNGYETTRYGRFDAPGPITINTPPLRPGSIYYVGFYAKTDSSIGLSSSTTGTMVAPPILDFYTGSVTNGTIPAGGEVLYRMIAPPEAGRLRFTLTPSATITVDIEQGTFPATSGSIHYHNTSWTPTAATYNQPFYYWPWVPNTTYYLRLSNPSASPVTFDFTSDSGAATIISGPAHTTVNVGETSRFTVLAGGNPTPTYQWRRNSQNLTEGGRFSGTNAATLVISDTQTADYGSYTVVVSNTTAAGETYTTTSSAASLSVRGVPLADPIFAPSVNVGVGIGGSTYFTTDAYSVSTQTYQWQRSTDDGETWDDLEDGAGLSGAQASRINLSGITAEQNGELYRIRFTNAIGSTTTEPARLQVNSPPVIETQPASQAVTVGDSITFSVVANGVPTPNYQWRKNGANLTGETNATLVLNNVTATDSADYTVRISNTVDSVISDTAALTVQFPPAITEQPQSQTVGSGASVTLNVVATGGPAPTYQWRKNGIDIPAATNASLVLDPISTDDAGNYAVYIRNAVGNVLSETAEIAVYAQPFITTAPQSQSVVAGSNVSLSVVATGVPTPTVQWRKDGVDIPGATESTLSFSPVAVADAGSYTVVLKNIVSTVTSVSATLTVTKDTAGVSLSNLTSTYDGSAHPATVTTTPNGLAVNVTYDGSTTVPTDAGSYAVVATVVDLNYSGSASGTLVIAKATPVITWSSPADLVFGPSLSATQLSATANVGGSFTYDPALGTVLDVGEHTLAVTFTPTDSVNYTAASAERTLTVTPASASLALDGLATTYNGTPQSVVVTTTPADLPVSVTYDDSATAPTQAGSYNVEATVTDPNYTGSTSGTLVIAKATPVITWTPGGPLTVGDPLDETVLNATADVDGTFVYTPPSGTQLDPGAHDLSVTFTSTDTANYTSTTVERSISIGALAVTIQTQPANQLALTGGDATFTVVASGTAPLSYQWHHNGTPIPGATSATLILSAVTLDSAGDYGVTVSNEVGPVESRTAKLTVIEFAATHRLNGSGYQPGETITVTNTLTYAGELSNLTWSVLPPAASGSQAWTLESSAMADDSPLTPIETTDLIEWSWTTPPTSPMTFSYTLRVPGSANGSYSLSAMAIVGESGQQLEALALPEPLRITEAPPLHSADTDGDSKINLSELLRVIELYNTRSGTTRTGEYHVEPGTPDGFAPGPAN